MQMLDIDWMMDTYDDAFRILAGKAPKVCCCPEFYADDCKSCPIGESCEWAAAK